MIEGDVVAAVTSSSGVVERRPVACRLPASSPPASSQLERRRAPHTCPRPPRRAHPPRDVGSRDATAAGEGGRAWPPASRCAAPERLARTDARGRRPDQRRTRRPVALGLFRTPLADVGQPSGEDQLARVSAAAAAGADGDGLCLDEHAEPAPSSTSWAATSASDPTRKPPRTSCWAHKPSRRHNHPTPAAEVRDPETAIPRRSLDQLFAPDQPVSTALPRPWQLAAPPRRRPPTALAPELSPAKALATLDLGGHDWGPPCSRPDRPTCTASTSRPSGSSSSHNR